MTKTIVIADDHHLISDGFNALLQALVPDSKILTSKTARQVDDYLAIEKDIDHIFIDLTLLDTKGLDYVATLITKILPEKICVISGETSRIVINTCRNLKIGGYIPKTLNEDALLSALHVILSGESYYPEHIDDAQHDSLSSPDAYLSKRQMEVLSLMGQGLANKEIAQMLGLSNETVKVHVSNLLTILNAPSRTAAVNHARKQGLI